VSFGDWFGFVDEWLDILTNQTIPTVYTINKKSVTIINIRFDIMKMGE
jgi:hypothetical protein